MTSFLPSLVLLGALAIVALLRARSRPSPAEAGAERRLAATALAIAAFVQAVHFGEEWATGFHARFPALFGLPPIPLGVFVLFNAAWIAIWIWSIPGVRSGRTDAYFAAWFLAIAGILNGVAHPVLAAASRSYFPGLVTSPVMGGVAIWLWRRLQAATRPAGTAAVGALVAFSAACAGSGPSSPRPDTPTQAALVDVLGHPDFISVAAPLPDPVELHTSLFEPEITLVVSSRRFLTRPPDQRGLPTSEASTARRLIVLGAWPDSVEIGIESVGWHTTRDRGVVATVSGRAWMFRRTGDQTWEFTPASMWAS